MPASRGRPPQGPQLLDKIADASPGARRRLLVIFQTLSGTLTIERACHILGIQRSAFHKFRAHFLAQALRLLEPRTPGRRKKTPSPEHLENQALRQEIRQLRLELQAQQLREEIGILMPHLLHRAVKKTPPNRRTQTRPRSDSANWPA